MYIIEIFLFLLSNGLLFTRLKHNKIANFLLVAISISSSITLIYTYYNYATREPEIGITSLSDVLSSTRLRIDEQANVLDFAAVTSHFDNIDFKRNGDSLDDPRYIGHGKITVDNTIILDQSGKKPQLVDFYINGGKNLNYVKSILVDFGWVSHPEFKRILSRIKRDVFDSGFDIRSERCRYGGGDQFATFDLTSKLWQMRYLQIYYFTRPTSVHIEITFGVNSQSEVPSVTTETSCNDGFEYMEIDW